jgi:SAM-dependent methyltransferase
MSLPSGPFAARSRLRPGTDQCPVCGATGERLFVPHGRTARPNARCSQCGSLERHRLVWTYLVSETDLLQGPEKRLLHLAPERPIRERLEHHPRLDYLSVDIDPRNAMMEMDITALKPPDASVDAVHCSHVLEHVPDDRKALSELLRVLRPGGWAILVVPIQRETTYEDPSITRPEERLRHFGQHDHVRKYGRRDFPDRIRSVGFEVLVDDFPRRVLGERLAARFRIRINDTVHFCRRPGAPRPRPLPPDVPPARTVGGDWTKLDPPELGRWVPERRVSVLVAASGRRANLELALAALDEQTYPRDLTEVVIVDRGAAHQPARVPTGEVLVFLGADLVPDPRYLEAHARWHHLVSDAVTLGARRHAEPHGLSADDVRSAARSGALVAALGEREHWPIDETRELGRPSDALLSGRREIARAMARKAFALRSQTLSLVTREGDPRLILEAGLGRRLLRAGPMLVPERKAVAWHVAPQSIASFKTALGRRALGNPLPRLVRRRSAGDGRGR